MKKLAFALGSLMLFGSLAGCFGPKREEPHQQPRKQEPAPGRPGGDPRGPRHSAALEAFEAQELGALVYVLEAKNS